MRAYTIHKFQICQLTDSTLVETSQASQQSDSFRVVKLEFVTSGLAYNYVMAEAKKWFLHCLNQFISHKVHISRSGGSVDMSACDLCEKKCKSYASLHIFEIVLRFLNKLDDFKAILPNPENPSYKSSNENLTELVKFANSFINLKIKHS